ncbi:MAG: homoserine O-succinyltransferase [Planctomycetes bacterium]|nr:homoserine O-succinyltransferase [Planctomycetota bacterium]
MSTTLTLARGARLFVRAAPFELEHDAPLAELALAYELQGPQDAPLLLVQGGISSDPHVAPSADDPSSGWWNAQVGPGRALDSDRFRVLSLEFLGKRDDAVVSSGDQARATALLLEELGVDVLHAAVGASYGGMVALRFAALFPERVERVVAISAADRTRPFAAGLRAVQRRLLALGRASGAASATAREAVALARALGLLSYRSPAELDERFAGAPSGAPSDDRFAAPRRFPIEEWLLGKGRRFAQRFDGAALARLSLAIDLHEVDVAAIRARTTFVAADPDLLVPPEQVEPLAARCGGPARFVRLHSRFGHDAFLKEEAVLAPLLAELIAEPIRATTGGAR